MNLLSCKKVNRIGSRDYLSKEFVDLIPEGRDEWQVLCPVSKLTGWPMSMQEAIFMITDKNSRLAEVLYQELPTIPSDPNVSDTDKLNMLASRLFVGSFAENDEMVNALGKIAAEFFPAAKVDEVVENAMIQFKANETPSVDE